MRNFRAVWTKRSEQKRGTGIEGKGMEGEGGGRERSVGREGGRREGEKRRRRRRDRREREKFYAFISSHIFIIMKRYKVQRFYHIKLQNLCPQGNQLMNGKHETRREYL